MTYYRRLAVMLSYTATFLVCQPVMGEVPPHASISKPTRGNTPARELTGANTSDARDDVILKSLRRRIIGLQKARLDNGLRVLMDAQPDSPTVAVCVTYDVGSKNEKPAQSGFAHLFEHMMFQGSRHVAKGQHFQMIAARGGILNGTTSADRTNYFETLPASELRLALWLEADRMRWLDVSKSNLDNQRAVVKEEYRMRYENAPYRLAQIELDRRVFRGYFPYEHPTIGSLEDLDRATLEWVNDFHRKYYAPNNAVLSIAGGFDPDEAMRWVHEYFDGAEKQPIESSSPPAGAPFGPPVAPIEITDKNAKTPALLLGWRIMPHSDPDHAALELLSRVLADGESSVLHELLVRQLAIARNVSSYTYDHAGPDALIISVEMTQNARFQQVESVIKRTLDTLLSNGPKPDQLQRAIQRVKSSFLIDLQTNLSRATTFGEYEVVFGDARTVVTDLERLLAVTPQQVKRALGQYVTTPNQVLVRVVPSDPQAQPSGGSHQ
jgi:predicted Zn-dependent peptidase